MTRGKRSAPRKKQSQESKQISDKKTGGRKSQKQVKNVLQKGGDPREYETEEEHMANVNRLRELFGKPLEPGRLDV